jgi:phage terminase small subunit
MATRGARPKPTQLHVVAGSYRGDRHAGRTGEPKPDGRPEKPKTLRGRASKLWDQFIARMDWLTWADTPKAQMWCHLQAEYERDPDRMIAARIGQLRNLGSELGFDPAGRARLGKGKSGEQEDPAAKYFA